MKLDSGAEFIRQPPADGTPDARLPRASQSPLLHAALSEHFRYQTFRPLQEAAVQAVLDGQNVLGVLGTGSGKSICYQLPTLMRQSGLTVVVMPTISLIEDQKKELKDLSIYAAVIHSGLEEHQKRDQWNHVKHGRTKFLFMSPEQLGSQSTHENLRHVKVSLMVIDEAHCISRWGHDFRPDYLMIPAAHQRLGSPPIAAFTATATVAVRDEILEALKIKDALQIVGNIARPNLDLKVERFAWEHQKRAAFVEHLREISAAGHPTSMIYFTRISTLEAVAPLAQELRLPFGKYHGDMIAHDRALVHQQFRSGQIKYLFATDAYGMGTNKLDVRNLLHYELPESLDTYWQQAGRAGRDGEPANCILMYSNNDLLRLDNFLKVQKPSAEFIEKVYGWLKCWIPYGLKEAPMPLIPKFTLGRFVDHYAVGDSVKEAKIIAAYATLVEFGLVRPNCGALEFPDSKALASSKVSMDLVNARADARRTQLLVMGYYATEAEDLHGTVLAHFNRDGVASKVSFDQLNLKLSLSPEQTKSIVAAVTNFNLPANSAVGYLRGTYKALDTEITNIFKDLTSHELEALLMAAHSQGIIRKMSTGQRSYWAPTEEGLKATGVSEAANETLKQLFERKFSPAPARILREAISGWFNEQRESLSTATDWKYLLQAFMTQEFSLLEQTVSGSQLSAMFVNVAKTRVTTEHAKALLNYLFEDVVGMEVGKQ